MEEAALAVNDIGETIEHAWQLVGGMLCEPAATHHLFKCVGSRKEVASIHKHDIVARGLRKTFVHGIIDAAVGLGLDDDLMTTVRLIGLLLIGFGQHERVVGRGTVDNEVLHTLIGLAQHTVERALQHRLGIIGDGDNRESYHSLKCFWAKAC